MQAPRSVARTPPWVLAAALAIAYLIVDPPSADLAAQTYRADLFSRAGLVLWDNAWYGGHHMPGYSVLFPPLAGWIGPRVVGALSAVAAAWLFTRLTDEHFGADGSRAGEWWFAAATAVNLVTGRLTFALGLTLALAAAFAVTHRRNAIGAALGALAALASPVAGAFLALAAAAWLLAGGRRVRGRGAALAAAALVPVLGLSVFFPEGGDEPFVASSFWPILAAIIAIWFALPRRERILRAGAILYAVAMGLSYATSTPMGGNVTRLGAVLAGPLIAALLWRRNRLALALLAVPLLYWQWSAPVRDWIRASGDPSLHAGYYEGVEGFFARERAGGAPPFRVEVPFTANHWEARWLAEHVPLARGWERQLDRKVNAVFYKGALTPARYERWLGETAVRFVALPDVPLDASAHAEARLLRAGLPGLRPVWRDAHWRVWEVRRPRPIAAGLTDLTTDGFVLRAARPGAIPTRIRWSPYWHVRAGDACVRRAGDFTDVVVRAPGSVSVQARFSPWRVRSHGTC